MFGVFDAIDLDYLKLPTAVGCFAWHDNPPPTVTAVLKQYAVQRSRRFDSFA